MASTPTPPSWSLTTHLLSLDKQAYAAATHAPFLQAAGQGRLGKPTLAKWLANDRLYTHAYIKAAGRVLATIDLPQTTPPPRTALLGRQQSPAAATSQLVDWLCDTMVALRREERLFVDVAKRYGLPPIDLEAGETTKAAAQEEHGSQAWETRRVRDEAKIPGLILFERLFGRLSVHKEEEGEGDPLLLPWLEAAVVFWGTEKVYLDAWTWAETCQQRAVMEGADNADADGGALRKELIPNWSSEEFVAFVSKLGDIVDNAVASVVKKHGKDVKVGLVGRAEAVWRELVAAEAAFWPDVE